MGGEERREKAFLKWGWCIPPGPQPVLILVGMAWSSQGQPLPGTEGHCIAHRWCGPSAYDHCQRREIYHLMWLTYLEVESIFTTSNKTTISNHFGFAISLIRRNLKLFTLPHPLIQPSFFPALSLCFFFFKLKSSRAVDQSTSRRESQVLQQIHFKEKTKMSVRKETAQAGLGRNFILWNTKSNK